MQGLLDPQNILGLFTLTLLEIVLGIDNIIFISILAGKLPPHQQPKARTIGLGVALITRVLLLLSIFLITKLVHPLLVVFGHPFSGRDFILIFGGLFLIAKSTHEIHTKIEGPETTVHTPKASSFLAVVLQIGILDIVFSLDSVITAVGMVQSIGIMITAVVLAMGVMVLSAGAISGFINRHPTVNMLALSFLLLIGLVLVADGFGQHISKGYIYFAMGFSIMVETFNMRLRKHASKIPAAPTSADHP